MWGFKDMAKRFLSVILTLVVSALVTTAYAHDARNMVAKAPVPMGIRSKAAVDWPVHVAQLKTLDGQRDYLTVFPDKRKNPLISADWPVHVAKLKAFNGQRDFANGLLGYALNLIPVSITGE